MEEGDGGKKIDGGGGGRLLDPKEERKQLQRRKQVQFAGVDDDDAEDEASRKRQPVLPDANKLKKKKKAGDDGRLGGLGLGADDNDDGLGGAFKSSENARAAAEARAHTRKIQQGGQQQQQRAQRRGTDDAAFGSVAEVERAEEEFQGDDEELEEMEPFNLKKEREEGYFDAEGNYVEYREDSELHDAWLDSAQVEPRYAEKAAAMAAAFAEAEKDGASDLSRAELAAIKRRIADILEPRETVLRALKRLGQPTGSAGRGAGNSNRGRIGAKAGGQHQTRRLGGTGGGNDEGGNTGRGSVGGRGGSGRGIGSSSNGSSGGGGSDASGSGGGADGVEALERKRLFDQLTEDAFRLMDSGEIDVYSEVRETFLREAEGYEALERARRGKQEQQKQQLLPPPTTGAAGSSSRGKAAADDGVFPSGVGDDALEGTGRGGIEGKGVGEGEGEGEEMAPGEAPWGEGESVMDIFGADEGDGNPKSGPLPGIGGDGGGAAASASFDEGGKVKSGGDGLGAGRREGKEVDMFGEDDEEAGEGGAKDVSEGKSDDPKKRKRDTEGLESGEGRLREVEGHGGNALPERGTDSAAGASIDSDYVWDEGSGMYYNSNIGYYYDSRSGLFCSATTGLWYKYDEASNQYEEVETTAAAAANSAEEPAQPPQSAPPPQPAAELASAAPS